MLYFNHCCPQYLHCFWFRLYYHVGGTLERWVIKLQSHVIVAACWGGGGVWGGQRI